MRKSHNTRKKRKAGFLCSITMAVSFLFGTIPAKAISVRTEQNAAQSSDKVGLVGNVFCTSESSSANHASLQWATTTSANHFILYRSTNENSGFTPIYEGNGTSCTDDAMSVGETYYYQLLATDGKSEWYSDVRKLTAVELPQGLNTYDNQKGSNLIYATSGTRVGNTYYNYSLKSHAGQKDIYLAETTSSDGIHFGNERNVADSSQNSALASCKIESVHITYMEKTGTITVWAHWEKPDGYSDGKALVITGKPGGQFTVHHVYNPLNIQVRDMAVFVDDDGTGYLIAAANKEGQGANATLYIFKMNDDYSDVTEIVTTLYENQYREFPNLIKKDGYYFLFTSQAAGWYPSSGAYSVTRDLRSGWSELRSIGNTSTFSSQSGWIVDLQGKNYLMHAYRWLRASESSGTTLCPLYFDKGFAFYDYCPYFKYSTVTGELYPVQTGELLSQDCNVSASLASEEAYSPEKAVDGSYQTCFAAIDDYKRWPFYLQMDLGCICKLSNIQTSWYICKGSEGYYRYTVEGSIDGTSWKTILDHTDANKEIVSKTYGFNSDLISGDARYVRLNVKSATLQNNPNNNWYTPTIYECKVFGERTDTVPVPQPACSFDFENNSGADTSGNHVALTLHENAGITADSQQGSVLAFDGSEGTYASLPDGFLDGCRDCTISMDVKNETVGDFFTFAVGKDSDKYAFFRVGNDNFRFAVTTDTWRGESVLTLDRDGTNWHHVTLVVNGATAILYCDGVFVAKTTELRCGLPEIGSNLTVMFGKSFYTDDVYMKGSIDNLKIYRAALTAEEVQSESGISTAGDVNNDGKCSIADAVMLQKWLLHQGEIVNPTAADMDKNHIVNALDLTLLKRVLLQ